MHANRVRTCSRNSREDNPSSLLKATSGDSEHLERSSLSFVILKNNPGRGLTESNSHWSSYQERLGNFNFSNRFDAEEVECHLNQPLDIIDGRTCMHIEVLAQRDDKLSSLLALGGSSNVRDITCGQSPLHYACADKTIKKRYNILKVLLNFGGDLYQRDDTGITPLSVLQVVDNTVYTTIVQKYLCTNCKIDEFKTVERLHEAVQQHGPLENFKKLYYSLSHDNSRITDLGHHTLLFRACKVGWIDGVSFLLSQTEEAPHANQVTNETPLHAACEGNHYEIVEQLITKFPELLMMKDKLPYRGWYPIHTACAYGTTDKILEAVLLGMLRLMEANDDYAPASTKEDVQLIDELGRSPLYIAVKCGNLSHIQLMTSPCLFNTLQQHIPSLYAITSGSLSQVSVIHCAVAHNRKEILHVLLDKFPLAIEVSAYPSVFVMTHMLTHLQRNVNGLDVQPIVFPLLETTICENNNGKLSLLSTSKAFEEYGVLSNMQLSSLAMAAAMGNEELTEALLNAGARDDDSLALRIAMFLQYHEIARLLLTAPDDTNLCLGDHKKLSTFSLPSRMLNNFRIIDLQHNCLDCVPLALFQCPALEVLNISNNQLTELPVTDHGMSSSNVFVLSSVLGSWKCRKLKILDISCNTLKALPAVVWKLPELEQLHAQENSLTSIETAIEVCARLEVIDISNNNLQNAPECVFRAKTVNVSHNQLKCLPTCIWYIEYLNHLRASNNQIAEITFPKSSCSSGRDRRLSSFTSRGRRKLCAEGNPSFFIHKNTKEMNESYSHGLIKLDLSHNKLTNFPTDLPCFSNNLQRLHISGNNIPVLYTCFIPPCTKHLEAQECSLDRIETIYDNKEHLCSHKTHTSLSNLSYLYLKGNALQQFAFINDSHDAGERDLRFPELKTLDLSKNQLNGQLDANIGLQKHLTTLILKDNPNLKSLPLELSCLSNTLTNVELDNLPGLKDLPKEYILAASRSPKRLLSYMKSRIKSSVQYRMLDLIIVGGSKIGKTSLMKSLNKKLKNQKFPVDKISIYDWEYSPPAGDGPDVVFKMWDFPSQEYDTTVNYCFYSKQALYLAVFNLTDGDRGVKELDIFFKNIKVHAPGCPVVIIGTHLDSVGVKEDDISEKVCQLYSDSNLFPAIAGVCCISNTKHINGSMKALRQKIYSVAMNLHTNGKNKLTLKVGKPLDDPDALLQQYIPKSYISLQNEVKKKSLELKQKNVAPLMHEKEFRQSFCSLFEDEEELASAVQFLHCQRMLFHFEECYLDAFYFLDLQWIFNTMANIIRIPDSNGTILNNKLIAQSTLVIPESLQPGFLALLAKFDFAIPCNNNYVLVYGLLPKQLESPMQSLYTPTLVKKPPTLVGKSPLNKIASLRKSLKKRTNKLHLATPSQVPVSDSSDNSKDDRTINTNIMDFTDTLSDNPTNKEIDLKEDNISDLPDGSAELSKASTSYKIPSSLPVHKGNVYHPKAFPQLSIVNSPIFEATSDLGSPHEMPSFGFSLKTTYSNPVIHPNLCRVWRALFVPDGFWPQLFTRIISDNRIKSILSTLLFTALKNNECTLDYVTSSDVPHVWKLYQKGFTIEHENMTFVQLKQVSSKFGDELTNQIELTVCICEIVLAHKTYKESESHKSTENVIRLATSILVLIEQHILDIGEEWFPGILCCSYNKEVLSYVPCSSCLTEKNSQITLHSITTDHQIICFDGCKAVCFSLKDLLVAYAEPSRTIKCPLHNEIHVQQLAPDMCFKDLDEDVVCGPDIPLKIDKDKELGQGGHALVLRGEILSPNKDHQRKLVAVKIITDELQRAQNFTDYLKSYTTSVNGYRMIRKEVIFLSTLCHQNLTQLCGVSTHPFMLLMELAPLGSLGSILKQYRAANQVLTPALLQASMYQVASAMAFLHEKHVVYLDLKSDNVLVWKYPIPGHQNTTQDVLLKITDYGISRICGATNEIRNNSLNGTPGFIAPEVLVGRLQDLKSDKIDVFSFGMFLYELITLLKPFELRTENPDSLVRKGQRPQIPKDTKENFTPRFIQKVMKACWNQDPMERPSMAQVVKWSQLPELQSLRIQYHLKPARLLSVGQCVVLRDHVHQYATNKPSNIQFTISNAEHFTSLFSSKSALTPKPKRKQSTTNHHSQVWIAQENKDTTSKLTIFTFRSSDLGFYVHEEDYTESKVVTMENVGNYMWVNTNDHRLHIVHTASMKTVACVTLKNSMLEVLQLLHVPEWHMVLVLWELSEIWCIHDEPDTSGLHVIGSLQLDRNIPINKLCKVTLSSTTTEVWATKKDKLITVLAETPSGCCESTTLQVQCTANGKHATLHCNLISCLQFSTDSENSLIHVWISFDDSPQLICWNGETKNQLHSVSLQCTGNATSLLGHKNHLYVGTSTGTVEVFESESGCFLQTFSWHAKVTALLKLPQEIKQSICAECSPTKCVKLAHRRSFQNNLVVPKKRVSQEVYLQRSASGSQMPFTSKSYKSGLYSMQQSTLLMDSPLIVSIGNDLADNLSIASNQSSMSRIVELLTWTGAPL